MNFNFVDKTEMEADIIAEVLKSENILFKTIKRNVVAHCVCEDGCEDEYMPPVTIPIYTISVYTTIEHFEFVKKITENRIKNIKMLDRCFYDNEFYEPLDEDDITYSDTKHKSVLRWLQILCKNLSKYIKQKKKKIII